MQSKSTIGINRRALLSGAAAVSALLMIKVNPTTIFTKFVEQDGWILKDDDLR